jgi:putative DNA primase/helicase
MRNVRTARECQTYRAKLVENADRTKNVSPPTFDLLHESENSSGNAHASRAPVAPQADEPARPTPDLLSFLPNDAGNADRLIALHGHDLRYCHALRKWLVWDGTRWSIDTTDQAFRLAKLTMVEFLHQAVNTHTREHGEEFARSSLDAHRVTNLLRMAQCEIYVEPGDLDKNPYLLNFLNGTVDLRTGELKTHDRGDRITKLIHYEYRPDASCVFWRAFLDQIMGGGHDAGKAELARAQRLTDYLQRAFGYSLTGSTREKAVFVLFGEGDNGKSTMLTTFRQLVKHTNCGWTPTGSP